MGETVVHDDGLVEGCLAATDEPIFARIELEVERHTIYYHWGSRRDSLVPRIMIQIVPRQVLEGSGESCVISMITWRQDTMTDDRWVGLMSLHENEIEDVKRLILEEWNG